MDNQRPKIAIIDNEKREKIQRCKKDHWRKTRKVKKLFLTIVIFAGRTRVGCLPIYRIMIIQSRIHQLHGTVGRNEPISIIVQVANDRTGVVLKTDDIFAVVQTAPRGWNY